VDSSAAYPGAGKGLAAPHLQALEALVLGDFRPDLTLLLDLSPQLGLARAHHRGEANRFEAESLAFMQRVRDCFLARAEAAPQRYVVIDAAQELPDVSAQILRVLEQRL
jgi:dTMP kinase